MTMHLERGLTTLNTKIKKSKKKSTTYYMDGWREHNKFLKRLKLAKMTLDEYINYVQGNYKPQRKPVQKMDLGRTVVSEPVSRTTLPQPKLSNKIGNGNTRSWKETKERLEISKQYSIVPAYNKGPYMVVSKADLKTAGKKV